MTSFVDADETDNSKHTHSSGIQNSTTHKRRKKKLKQVKLVKTFDEKRT